MSAYATLALTLAYGLAGSDRPVGQKAVIVFLGATGYGVLMEIGQAFVPDRTASFVDVLFNAVGSIAGLGWIALESRVQFVSP